MVFWVSQTPFKIDSQLPQQKSGAKKLKKIKKTIYDEKTIYHLLTIFLIIKVKVGLNLHFLFISCKVSV